MGRALRVCQRPECGKEFEPTHGKGQRYCSRRCVLLERRTFSATYSELKRLVWKHPVTEVARMFRVSDQTIRKRCRRRGIETPPRGYWAKKRRDENAEH